MKLSAALFREPYLAYQVEQHLFLDNEEDFANWELLPIRGHTLAGECVQGPFEGLFIIAAQLVSAESEPEPCYLDLVLPATNRRAAFPRD